MGALIVTGASRGIGAAIARLAAARGYAVAVNFSSGETEANKIAADIVAAGGHAIPIHADISSEDQILTLFQTAERELGPIKGLVNNAGVAGGFARVENVTAEAIEKTFAVNVTGAMLVVDGGALAAGGSTALRDLYLSTRQSGQERQ